MENYASIDVRDRRLVILASKDKAKELKGQINWSFALSKSLPLASSINVGRAIMPVLLTTGGISALGIPLILLPLLLGKKFPYPIFDFDTARDQFDFSVNHPVDGGLYSCCDAEPSLYVPLRDFHRYMYEAKMSAFQEICANLGVRTCNIVYAEENGKKIDINSKFSNIPTQAGVATLRAKGGVKSNKEEKATTFMEYPRPKTPPTTTETRWMNGEPTWKTMQKLRMERDLQHYRAEFEYSDEMGVNAEAAAKVNKMGLDIGGKFQEINRRKWIFDIDFWSENKDN
jgi:hypothetical protein